MSRTMYGYFDKQGDGISHGEWLALTKDPAYVLLRQYDNGQVRATVTWEGKVLNPQNMLPDFYPVLRLSVSNYASDGSRRPDPVEDGKTFPNETAAVAAYEEFLERWTASHRVEDGQTGESEFVEVDNDLAPPPPPDKDAPMSTVPDDDDGIGAW